MRTLFKRWNSVAQSKRKEELAMEHKLFDSERRVMELLWQHGDLTAKELSQQLAETAGWNKNTTYTVIKKCVEKGYIHRQEPGFLCHALLTQSQVQQDEAGELVDKVFSGSPSRLFASLLGGGRIDKDEIDKLRRMIDEYQ